MFDFKRNPFNSPDAIGGLRVEATTFTGGERLPFASQALAVFTEKGLNGMHQMIAKRIMPLSQRTDPIVLREIFNANSEIAHYVPLNEDPGPKTATLHLQTCVRGA